MIWTQNSKLRGQKENAAEPKVKGNTKGAHRACWGPRSCNLSTGGQRDWTGFNQLTHANYHVHLSSVSSVAQLCLALCNPMDCSMSCFPVHHQLPELAQTHVHQISDAILPPHLLSSPAPPAFNLSQHQGLSQ